MVFSILTLFSGFSSTVVHGAFLIFVLSHLCFPALSPVLRFTNLNFKNGSQQHIFDTTSSCAHAAVSQEWRLELTQRAHSTVSSGDQESFGVETAKRVLEEFANMYPSQLFKKPIQDRRSADLVSRHTLRCRLLLPKNPDYGVFQK